MARGARHQGAFAEAPDLEIAGALPGAQVKVDQRSVGQVAGNGTFRTEVIGAGRHALELTNDGYNPARLEVDYLRPVPVGSDLHLRAECTAVAGRSASRPSADSTTACLVSTTRSTRLSSSQFRSVSEFIIPVPTFPMGCRPGAP